MWKFCDGFKRARGGKELTFQLLQALRWDWKGKLEWAKEREERILSLSLLSSLLIIQRKLSSFLLHAFFVCYPHTALPLANKLHQNFFFYFRIQSHALKRNEINLRALWTVDHQESLHLDPLYPFQPFFILMFILILIKLSWWGASFLRMVFPPASSIPSHSWETYKTSFNHFGMGANIVLILNITFPYFSLTIYILWIYWSWNTYTQSMLFKYWTKLSSSHHLISNHDFWSLTL